VGNAKDQVGGSTGCIMHRVHTSANLKHEKKLKEILHASAKGGPWGVKECNYRKWSWSMRLFSIVANQKN